MAQNDPLSGLLGALVGGHPAVQNHMQNTGQSLDQVLGSLSNAANAQAGGGAAAGSMGDLLGSLMGASQQSGGASSSGGDPMSALLGGLLGGGMAQGGAPKQGVQSAGADPMSALLGGLLGGGMQGGTPAAGALGNNAFLAPIVDSLAAKIGIPPQVAEIAASFALTQLMSSQRDPKLAQMLGSKGAVTPQYLRESGLADQLAQKAGIDQQTAVKSLQQVMQAYGTQMSGGTTASRQKKLQSWHAAK